MKPFAIDGKSYNAHVQKLTRKFAVLDSDKTGRTQNGSMYRDPIGTFYNYTMVIEPMAGYEFDFDQLWDILSQPQKSHTCTFPYNQTTMTQEMYVTGGSQDAIQIKNNGVLWGGITIDCIATDPKVVP